MQESIVDQGIEDVMSLMILQTDHIKRACKVIHDASTDMDPVEIAIMQEQYLEAFPFWAKIRVRLGQPIHATLFTCVIARSEASKLIMALEDNVISDKDAGAKPPNKYTGQTKWNVFKEAMDTYVNQLPGSGQATLNYIICELDEPDDDEDYANDVEEAIAIAPLTGDAFEHDNR